MVLESRGNGVREGVKEGHVRPDTYVERYGYGARDYWLWCERVTVMALKSNGNGV
jgi:hypothetical protein